MLFLAYNTSIPNESGPPARAGKRKANLTAIADLSAHGEKGKEHMKIEKIGNNTFRLRYMPLSPRYAILGNDVSPDNIGAPASDVDNIFLLPGPVDTGDMKRLSDLGRGMEFHAPAETAHLLAEAGIVPYREISGRMVSPVYTIDDDQVVNLPLEEFYFWPHTKCGLAVGSDRAIEYNYSPARGEYAFFFRAFQRINHEAYSFSLRGLEQVWTPRITAAEIKASGGGWNVPQRIYRAANLGESVQNA